MKKPRIFQAMLLGIVLLVSALGWMPAAKAAPCRAVGDAQRFSPGERPTVCIVEIKRSAKYPWEYRVILSQDEVKQPQEIYNCRDRVRLGRDGVPVPFQAEGTGDWICRLVKRT